MEYTIERDSMEIAEKIKTACAEIEKRCSVAEKDAEIYDTIQNDVMCELFGDDYYDHIGLDDEVEEAYNETSAVRADYVMKIEED